MSVSEFVTLDCDLMLIKHAELVPDSDSSYESEYLSEESQKKIQALSAYIDSLYYGKPITILCPNDHNPSVFTAECLYELLYAGGSDVAWGVEKFLARKINKKREQLAYDFRVIFRQLCSYKIGSLVVVIAEECFVNLFPHVLGHPYRAKTACLHGIHILDAIYAQDIPRQLEGKNMLLQSPFLN